MKVDLHMHTVHSDGEDTLRNLTERVKQAELDYISITDHDTISAYDDPDFKLLNDVTTVIPGIEINSDGEQGELHILGYGIDLKDEKLRSYCDWRRKTRIDWSKKIVHQLNELGFLIEWDNCMKRATGGIIVRTHIAQEVASQYPGFTAKEIYHSFLVKGKSAYFSRPPYSSKQAIQLIQEAGGIAILAHPGIYKHNWSWSRLQEEGIQGVEAFHSRHNIKMTNKWIAKANESGLFISVGSDYHGKNSRNPYLPGSTQYDYCSLLPLLKRLKERKINFVI